MKSCSRHSKTCKSIKTANLIFLRKEHFHLLCTEKIKIRIAAPPSKLCPHKSYQCHLLLKISRMHFFSFFFFPFRFHAVEDKINKSQKSWEKWNNSDTCSMIATKIYRDRFVRMQLNMKFHKIPSISFRVVHATKFSSQIDIF